MTMNKLYCNDGCQKEFNVSEMKVGVDALIGGIEHHYIQCPDCKQKYTSYYTDEKIRALQVQVKMIQKKAPLKIKQRNQLNKLIRRMQFMSNQIKMKVEQDAINKT